RNIHFHFHKCTAEGVSVILDLVAALSGQMSIVCQVVQLLCRQLAKRHQHLAVCRPDDISVHDIQIFLHLPCQIMGSLDDLLSQEFSCLPDGEACHVSLS